MQSVFLHLFLFEFIYAFLHCFRIARSAIAVQCDHRVARHLWTLLLSEPEPELSISRQWTSVGTDHP